ncbi:MAG: Uncharacterised protein [Cryomorphaceae bacterium]|nr:MAG: Uncharacterised protein [Cryomorphaceae bacterium]
MLDGWVITNPVDAWVIYPSINLYIILLVRSLCCYDHFIAVFEGQRRKFLPAVFLHERAFFVLTDQLDFILQSIAQIPSGILQQVREGLFILHFKDAYLLHRAFDLYEVANEWHIQDVIVLQVIVALLLWVEQVFIHVQFFHFPTVNYLDVSHSTQLRRTARGNQGIKRSIVSTKSIGPRLCHGTGNLNGQRTRSRQGQRKLPFVKLIEILQTTTHHLTCLPQ